jgi:putative ABC transport system permease protein
MRAADILRFAGLAALGYPLRTSLLILAMAIGVASVVVLTALGDGARRYVLGEFSALGSNLVIVLPGRTETKGFNPATFISGTPRDLTVDDALYLLRAPAVLRMAPLAVGTAEAAFGGKLREVTVVGTNADFIKVRQLKLAQGRFLPSDNVHESSAVVVLGAKVRDDLFGAEPALGRVLRLGDRRFRIIGVLAARGQGLGTNTDELAILPVGQAQAMFNSNSLFRILVEARGRGAIEDAKAQIRRILMARHEGEEDFTLITQDAVLATFDKILGALTLAVAGIAGISLSVAGILVMNVMLVSVTQRTGEVGLLKALGAAGRTIRLVFLTEAAMLSLAGAAVGLALGYAGAGLIRQLYPVLPAYPPQWAVLAGVGTAVVTGVVFGLLPAGRAARLDPVEALMKR